MEENFEIQQHSTAQHSSLDERNAVLKVQIGMWAAPLAIFAFREPKKGRSIPGEESLRKISNHKVLESGRFTVIQ